MRGLLAAVVTLAVPVGAWAGWTFPTLQGEEIPLERFYEGKWCLDFVVAPECLACAVSIGWLRNWQAEQTQSRIQVALVVPWDTPELRAALEGVPFPVLVDSQFILASWFKVQVAPTVVLFAEATFVKKLEWPFQEEELRTKLSELEEFVIPRPQDLLGQEPPDFSGVDLAGSPVASEDLPRPVLLFFFSTACPACRASLEMMDDLTRLVPVVLIVLTKGHELTPEDLGKLRDLKGKYGERLRVVLLGDREKEVMDHFRVRWTPTFFLVNAAGTLRAVWEGANEALPREIADLMQETGDL